MEEEKSKKKSKEEIKHEKLMEIERQAKADRIQFEATQKHKAVKKDNQRKFLLGALVLEGLEEGDPAAEAIRSKLDKFLSRDHERALFELAPLSGSEKESRNIARARRVASRRRAVSAKEAESTPTETAWA